MNDLNKVRELRRPGDSDLSVARAALENEIASGGRNRSRRITVGILGSAGALGAVAVVAVVATSLTGLQQPPAEKPAKTSEASVPKTQPNVQLASAKTILANAADVQVDVYDVPLKAGEFLRTTYTMDQVLYLNAGQDGAPQPFEVLATDAIAAVNGRGMEQMIYRSADPAAELTIDSSEFYGTEAFGDTAAANAAWAKYYEAAGAPRIGEKAPRTVWRTAASYFGSLEEGAPTDPQEFLDAWKAHPPVSGMPINEPALDQLWRLLADDQFANASGRYRATVLNALALTDGAEVISNEGGVAVLRYKGGWGTYQVTVDTAKGQITKVQVARSRGVVMVPDSTEELGYKDVLVDHVRPSFLPDGVFDMTVTISQDVVNSAPQTGIYDD